MLTDFCTKRNYFILCQLDLYIFVARSTNEPGVPALDIEFEMFKYTVAYPSDQLVDMHVDEVINKTVIPVS